MASSTMPGFGGSNRCWNLTNWGAIIFSSFLLVDVLIWSWLIWVRTVSGVLIHFYILCALIISPFACLDYCCWFVD